MLCFINVGILVRSFILAQGRHDIIFTAAVQELVVIDATIYFLVREMTSSRGNFTAFLTCWIAIYLKPFFFFFYYHPVSSAHRYHQAKASGQGQGGQSKSSSAHSSRSTSPGPHWRNDAIAPYKPPDRRSLEPSSAASASSSSTRPGRSRNPSGSSELDSGSARTLLPKPPRDRSEPRHFNPLR